MARLVSSLLSRARVRLAAWRAGRIDSPAAARVAGALGRTLRGELGADERAWVERIEAKRRALAGDPTEIVKTDYGAGRRNAHRSADEMYQGVVSTTTIARACRASKPCFWATLLFQLVREFEPLSAVELGTCLGISAAYQAAAQSLNGNGGTLMSLEGDPALAALATDTLGGLGLKTVEVVPGRFLDTLAQVLAEREPVDYAFIDGHHDGPATVAYFEQFLPHLKPGAVLLFDDIAWPGMRPAWRAIQASSAVTLSLDLREMGLAIVGKPPAC